MSDARADGFTLLEMLISIAVTAFVVATAIQAYLSIRHAQESALGAVRRDGAAEVFLDRFERELAGAMLVVKAEDADRLADPWLFYGVDRIDEGRDTDALTFVTRTPARISADREPGSLRMVSYAVVYGDAGELDLVRGERALPRELIKQVDVSDHQLVLDDVARLSLRYMGEQGWRDDWDSTDIALQDQLPTEVDVAVQLWEEAESGELVEGSEHRRMIPLPLRPIDFAALREQELEARGLITAEESEQDENCFRLEECYTLLKEQAMDEGGDDVAIGQRLQMLAQAMDQTAKNEPGQYMCWDSEGPAAARFRRIEGVDISVCGP